MRRLSESVVGLSVLFCQFSLPTSIYDSGLFVKIVPVVVLSILRYFFFLLLSIFIMRNWILDLYIYLHDPICNSGLVAKIEKFVRVDAICCGSFSSSLLFLVNFHWGVLCTIGYLGYELLICILFAWLNCWLWFISKDS